LPVIEAELSRANTELAQVRKKLDVALEENATLRADHKSLRRQLQHASAQENVAMQAELEATTSELARVKERLADLEGKITRANPSRDAFETENKGMRAELNKQPRQSPVAENMNRRFGMLALGAESPDMPGDWLGDLAGEWGHEDPPSNPKQHPGSTVEAEQIRASNSDTEPVQLPPGVEADTRSQPRAKQPESKEPAGDAEGSSSDADEPPAEWGAEESSCKWYWNADNRLEARKDMQQRTDVELVAPPPRYRGDHTDREAMDAFVIEQAEVGFADRVIARAFNTKAVVETGKVLTAHGYRRRVITALENEALRLFDAGVPLHPHLETKRRQYETKRRQYETRRRQQLEAKRAKRRRLKPGGTDAGVEPAEHSAPAFQKTLVVD
jgi:hypothetical protein